MAQDHLERYCGLLFNRTLVFFMPGVEFSEAHGEDHLLLPGALEHSQPRSFFASFTRAMTSSSGRCGSGGETARWVRCLHMRLRALHGICGVGSREIWAWDILQAV